MLLLLLVAAALAEASLPLRAPAPADLAAADSPGRRRAPTLSTVAPSPITPQQILTLTGSGFGAVAGNAQVNINGVVCPIATINDTQVTCTVPWMLPRFYYTNIVVSSASSGLLYVQISGLAGFSTVMLKSGSFHTCLGVGAKALLYCWGDNNQGRLGIGSTTWIGDGPGEMPPVASNVGAAFSDFELGGAHTCVIVASNGAVRCFGKNDYGQLGYGNSGSPATDIGDTAGETPSDITLPSAVSQLALASSHTCALRASGQTHCWGRNDWGQLGYGNTVQLNAPSTTPVNVALGASICSGAYHNCILTSAGAVYCFGLNLDGQLGIGSTAYVGNGAGQMPPAAVNLGSGVVVWKMTCGNFFVCVIQNDWTIKCWGDNVNGQLGRGTVASPSDNIGDQAGEMPPPALSFPQGSIYELGPQKDLVVGANCALDLSGNIACLGDNSYGQLGTGSTTALYSPPSATLNFGGLRFHTINPGGSHFCALSVTGDVRCVGRNTEGQAGVGSTNNIGDAAGEMPPAATPVPPILMSLSPTTVNAHLSQTLTLVGFGFGTSGCTVSLGAVNCPVSQIAPMRIICTPAFVPGSYSVTVTRTGYGTSNSVGTVVIPQSPSRTRTRTRTKSKRTRTRTQTKRTRTRTQTKRTRTRTLTRTATKLTRTRTATLPAQTPSRSRQTRTRTRTVTRTLTRQTKTRTKSKQTQTATPSSTPSSSNSPGFISFVATLNEELSELQLTFALRVRSDLQSTSNCDVFFSPAQLASFGVGATCRFSSATTLIVSLGIEATVTAGSAVSLVSSAIRSAADGRFAGGSAAVTVVPGTPDPEAAISGPQTIGSCDGVVLGGSTTQSGNRPSTVQYIWSVVSPSTHNITLPSMSASTWAIPASSLAPATTYVFGLQTTNFLGRTSAVATTSVTKSTVAVPVLEGPAQVGVTTGDRATLVQVSLRAAPCTPAGTAWSATWSFAPGSPTFVLDTRSKTSLALAVNPASLTTGVEYNLLLTVSSAALGVSTSTGVVVERAGAALVAVIQGRSSVASDEALVLDALQSYDPDTTGETASFSWSCVLCATAVVSDVPCAQTCIGFSGSNSPVLSIGTGQLVAQRSYIFTVTYTKGLRSTTASRVVAVQPPSEVAVAVAISQANVLWQLTRTLTLQSDVCDTANPAVEIALVPSVVGTIISGVGWVFEGVDSSANRSVPVAVTEAVVGSSSSEAGLRIPASVLVDWQGYTFYIRVNALLGGTNIGSAVVCFRVGIAPVIGSFSVQQVDGRLRYSAVLASNARADYVIGFRTLSGGPRTFISFQQIFRTVTYSTVSRLSYYQNLVSGQRFLAPCPAATVFAFVFACQSGICVEQEAIAPLDCASLAKTAALPDAKRASVGDCAAVPDPFGQALCAVQAVQTTPGSATAAAAALSVIKSAHAAVPAGYGSLMVFAGHHAAVVAAAGDAVPTDVSALKQLLSDPSFAAPLTLDALFASVSAQISGQCTTAAAETLAQFGQKALETRACGGTPAVFATSAVGVVATQAVVGASGRVDLGLTGQGVSHVVVEGAGSTGSCAGIAASVQGADCGAESGPFVLALGVESGFSRISFDAEAGGECVAWDESAGAWSETGCTRSGVRCTCGAASKYTVREAKKSGGGSNAGAIAGGVIGAVVGVGAGVGGALWWRKKQGGRGAADVELR